MLLTLTQTRTRTHTQANTHTRIADRVSAGQLQEAEEHVQSETGEEVQAVCTQDGRVERVQHHLLAGPG